MSVRTSACPRVRLTVRLNVRVSVRPQAQEILSRLPTTALLVTQVLPRADPDESWVQGGPRQSVPRWRAVDGVNAALPAAIAAGVGVSDRGRLSVVDCGAPFLVRVAIRPLLVPQ